MIHMLYMIYVNDTEMIYTYMILYDIYIYVIYIYDFIYIYNIYI